MAEEKPMGIYVHIPFCSKKCDYCDFVSYSMDKKAQQLYLEALFAEIDKVKHKFIDKTFDSIFIGGGTPSLVYEGFIASLSRKLHSSFKIDPNAEFTIEVNPSSFSEEKFYEYVEAGINRISVGVQCLDDKLLATVGRIQDEASVKETFKILSTSGFTNVNSDVMIGLPHQSRQSVIKTIKFLIKNKVKHVSVYSLQVEKHTVLFDKLRQGTFDVPNDRAVLNLYNEVYELLKQAGFKRYEVSNFAKPGFECKHNMKYWNDVDYLGLGVAAHGFIDGYRYSNTKRLDTYIEGLIENKSPICTKEFVAYKERKIERIMLSLRTIKGLNLEQYKQDFNEDLLITKAGKIKKLIELNMVEIVDGYLRITEAYFHISNSIMLELL